MRLPISQKSMTLAQMLVKYLTLGTEIVVPNSESQGKDSVDLIRDSLFSIQVQQPWLLLQFDDSNIEEIGEDRSTRFYL